MIAGCRRRTCPNATAGSTTYSVAYNESVITSGQYTFWSYEHLFVTTATAAGTGDNEVLAGRIVNELTTGSEIVNQHSGYLLSDIVNAHVSKAVDGGPIIFTN